MDLRLHGKTAIVTGANNPYGIGAAIARALADEGVSLLVTYCRDHSSQSASPQQFCNEFYEAQQGRDCDDLLSELRRYEVTAEAIEVDLRSHEGPRAVFDRAAELFPHGIDIVVNNAAYCKVDTMGVHDEKVDDAGRVPLLFNTLIADDHFAVNARSVAALMNMFALQFVQHQKSSGRIINVSTDGARCFPGEVSYGASKSALESYTRSAARELGYLGITANVISPGPVQTGWLSPDHEEKILPTIPVGRLGVPQDIADAVLFLASERASWISGVVLHVGGGHAA